MSDRLAITPEDSSPMATKPSSPEVDLAHAAMFPVGRRAVHVEIGDRLVKQSHFSAIVDVERSHVFSVVADDYDLITNERAIALGRQCFRQIFKLTDVVQMKCFNVIMPKTRSFCHIDFLHEPLGFTPLSNKDDQWQPYLRVTNSYNRMYALNFDLGFCRWICRNGMIFGKKNIEFKFSHSKRSQDPVAVFTLRSGEFAALEVQFQALLVNLQRYHVPRKLMWPLFCKAFQLRIPKQSDGQAAELFQERLEAVRALTAKYFDQMGENGYAAVNVLTDYATRPTAEKSMEARINGLQSRCGDWMSDFVGRIEQRNFSFEEYLGDYYVLAT